MTLRVGCPREPAEARLMHAQRVTRGATKKKPHTATQCEAYSSTSRDGGI